MSFPLGRRTRGFSPAVPHWSAIRYMLPQLPTPPAEIDYVAKLPPIGMFGNDQWGCCAEAGAAHLIQLWRWNAYGTMPPISTAQVLQAYSEITGFDENAGPPGGNPTDRGTALQDLLSWWLKTGFPLADGTRHKIIAYFEVDPRNTADLNLGTAESAGLYLGFNVPKFLEQQESPGSIWGATGGDTTIVGGHCVTSGGYGPTDRREIESWGSTDYAMTAGFFSTYVDEAYVVVAQDFVEATGKTPYGLPLTVWEQQMSAIR